MTDNPPLFEQACIPCTGGIPSLSQAEIQDNLALLHSDWLLGNEHKVITRKFVVKGFAKAVYLANLTAFLADSEGHHPDIAFGWGYCAVSFTTHDSGGLTINDFICAQKLDRMNGGLMEVQEASA